MSLYMETTKIRRVPQTTFGTEGNCFAACVASILNLPIEDVPNFCAHGAGWWFHFMVWCKEREIAVIAAFNRGTVYEGWYLPHIVSGMGPRGLRHSVVGVMDQVLWDPHPDGTGLSGEPEEFNWMIPMGRMDKPLPYEEGQKR